MKTSRKMALAAGLTITLLVGGCSGDSGGGTAAPVANGSSSVPDSAGVTVAAFLAYLEALNPNDESSEPSSLSDGFAVPPDEENDPKKLS